MPPVGFEPAIPATERKQTDALDGAATGISHNRIQALLPVLKHRKTVVRMIPMMAAENSQPFLKLHSSSAVMACIYYPKTPIAG